MAETLKEKLSAKDKWFRLIFMVIFAIVVYCIGLTLVWLIAIFQFIYSLFVGKPNKTLLPFGGSLSKYIYQMMAFLTYASEEKPFPFGPWPSSEEKPKPKK